MGWFENTIALYPTPERYPQLFVPGSAPSWKPSPSDYGSTLGWELFPTEENILKYVYPARWFQQMQRYIQALLANKPSGNPAEITDQVYWSVTLMGAVSQAMWAFNVNDVVWSAAFYGNWDYQKALNTINASYVQQRCKWNPLGLPRVVDVLSVQSSPDLLRMNEHAASGKMQGSMIPWRIAWEESPWADIKGPKPDYTKFWPTAPFLHPPLMFDYIKEAFCYMQRCTVGQNISNVSTASWWDDWISSPKAQYVPWAAGSDAWLDQQELNLIARTCMSHDKSADHGWARTRQYTDARATTWYWSERRKLAKRADPKRAFALRMWKLLAVSYRHPNADVLLGPDGCRMTGACPEFTVRPQNGYIPTLDDTLNEALLARGVALPAFPLFVNGAATVDWSNTFDFANAYDGGYYDVWGKWLADVDMPSLMEGLGGVYMSFVGTGYVDQMNVKVADGARVSTRSFVGFRVFTPKKTWDAVVKAKKLNDLSPVLRIVLRIVGFVVAIVTQNVKGFVSNMVGMIEDNIDKAKSKGLMPWQYMALQPQGYLRTLMSPEQAMDKYRKDLKDGVLHDISKLSVASFDTAKGDFEDVWTRIAHSIEDCVAAVQKVTPKPQRGKAELPPSKGGPPAATLPFLALQEEKQRGKVLSWSLWGAAAAAVGYGTWRVLQPQQRAKVKRSMRRLKA